MWHIITRLILYYIASSLGWAWVGPVPPCCISGTVFLIATTSTMCRVGIALSSISMVWSLSIFTSCEDQELLDLEM